MDTRHTLRTSGLGKRYGERTALQDLSFELSRGEVVALLGPNGAGKTTTLRLLAGLLAPTSGTVAIDGEIQTERTWPATRRKIGFLTETPGLWDRLSVEANLLTYARLYGLADPRSRVDALLRQLDLADRAQDPAGSLSKGMRQKVAIARALLPEPAVLLLDEPTAGLDPAMTRTIRELIHTLRQQDRAVLLSTHNLDEAERVADRVAVLKQHLVAIGAPQALRSQWGGRRVRITLATIDDALATVAAAAGATAVAVEGHALVCHLPDPERDTPGLVRALVDHGAAIRRVVPDEADLEEIYLALLRDEGDAPGSALAGNRR
jgi:ABC-2 type transport system ATP-binding protein